MPNKSPDQFCYSGQTTALNQILKLQELHWSWKCLNFKQHSAGKQVQQKYVFYNNSTNHKIWLVCCFLIGGNSVNIFLENLTFFKKARSGMISISMMTCASLHCIHGLRTPREETAFTARPKFNPNPKFLGTAEAYFVCHIDPIFQMSLIYAFTGCP